MKYEERLKDTEIKLANRPEFRDSTRLYEKYINILKKYLLAPKKTLIPIKAPQRVTNIDKLNMSDGKIKYFDKIIKENPKM